MSQRPPSWPTEPVTTSLATVELTPDIDGGGVTLMINGTENSHHYLADPKVLVFEYMQQMQAVLRTHLGATPEAGSSRGRLRVLHVGAAGCTMASAIHAEWPASHQVAIEIDALLAQYVRDWFDLPRSPHLRIRIQDGLEALHRAPPGRFEVIIRDAFQDRRVPDHLTTLEFTGHARRALTAGGIYLANRADHPPLTQTRREAATLREVFSHVYLIIEPGVLRGRRYGNAVLVASARPPQHALHRVLRTLPAPARILDGAELTRFIGDQPPIPGAPAGTLA